MKATSKHKHVKKKNNKKLAIKDTFDDVLKVIAKAGDDKLKKKK